jgi:hypothetical protein
MKLLIGTAGKHVHARLSRVIATVATQAVVSCAILLAAGSCGMRNERGQPNRSEYETARDPAVFFTERLEAASRLGERDRARLRLELMAELPGDWDLATLTAVQVLGVIGDAETSRKLEALDKLPRNSTGVFHPVIVEAVKKIRDREHRKESSEPSPPDGRKS